jgi:glyoxylase-like metal-dependent hydrolase (beta-lactamase superfamily II)
MKIKAFQVGDLGTNCYVVWDETTLHAAIIDPGDDGKYLLDSVKQLHLELQLILLTHGHFDHTGAVMDLYNATGAPVYIHQADKDLSNPFGGQLELPADVRFYGEGDTVTLDSLSFHVLHTPGHTPGSVCLMAEDVLFTGDTLFRGSCGRTDFPGGSWSQMCKSLKRLYELPGDYAVLCGHTGSSKLSFERQTNDFMRSAVQE